MLAKILIFAFAACLLQAVLCQMVGGWSDVEDTNSENFQKIVSFATDEISVQLGSSNKKQAIEILSGRQQVVAGMKYKIVMRIGETDCKVDENDKDCNLKSGGEIHKCSAVVWDRAWLNETKLLDYSCEKQDKTL
uniref:U20-Lycotoxin-Lsp1a_1 n=1 Tax=Lycosa sp. SGP-2016 TaxID=1905177 RepID=A0A482ZE59_9ARAC